MNANEWLNEQEPQADLLPRRLLYTGNQIKAAFETGRGELSPLPPKVSGDEVERVAKAIWSAETDAPAVGYTLKMRLSFDEAARAARAAILAMRSTLVERK